MDLTVYRVEYEASVRWRHGETYFCGYSRVENVLAPDVLTAAQLSRDRFEKQENVVEAKDFKVKSVAPLLDAHGSEIEIDVGVVFKG